MSALLWFVIVALFVLWIIGLGVKWAASAVWVMFIIAMVLLIINLLSGLFTRRRAIT